VLRKAYATGDQQVISQTRWSLGKESFRGFVLAYYFEAMKYKNADFLEKWQDLLEFDEFEMILLIGFRGSAKTSLAKIWATRVILYKIHELVGYVCYEKEKASESLFDIMTWLQSHPLIIQDFGDQFEKPIDLRPEKKTQGNFVTTSGVRVTAISISQTVRGKLHEFERPNCYIVDDFENNTTKRSAVMTFKTKEFFRELLSGLGNNPNLLFISNYISDTGSVAWLEGFANGNKDFHVERQPLILDGKITWPDKYVLTDTEREKSKQEEKPISIEALKRKLNKDGEKVFEQEMLLEPITKGDMFFDREIVDKRIKAIGSAKPVIKDGWKIWDEYRKGGNYAIAADVAEGFGNDSSVIQVIDLDNGKQVREFESNLVQPSRLGKMMVEQGVKANNCILCPERNSIGVAVVDSIKNEDYNNIYREKSVDKISNKPVQRFGWYTSSKTKPMMLFEFKRDFEAGEIEINSLQLLREMRAFTNDKVTDTRFDSELSNHFDRVMAFAIVWQMRKVNRVKGFVNYSS